MSDSPILTLVETIDRVGAGAGPPGLDVSADLTVHVAGHRLAVEAYTDRVFVDFPSVGSVLDVLRATPGGSGEASRALPAALAAADLTAVARVGSREVATLGADASSPLGYLGYDHVAVSPRHLLLSAVGV